jgi:hypothetical protein
MDALRHPSGFLPLLMSSAIIAFGIRDVAMFGLHPADETTAAHLFQILLPAEIPLVLFFAATWLPRARRQALAVLALQIGAAMAIVATVFALGL